MSLRRRAVVALCFTVVASLMPAVAAAAPVDEPGALPGQVLAPPLPPITDGSVDVVAPPEPGAPATTPGQIDAPVPSAAFTAPANEDFALSFGASVDDETRRVIRTAAGIWSEVIDARVPVTVRVTMEPMAPGMLGTAGSTSAFYGEPGLPRPDVLYPVALANQLAGRDLDVANPDIVMELSSSMTWDKRVDGTTPPAAQSLLSVAVHELAHGLGHASWVRPSGGGWEVTYVRDGVTLAYAYDRLVAAADGTPISALTGTALGQALTSSLRWTGALGRQANRDEPPRLYSPSPFELGSSVGHLDERAFGSAVMTPFLGRAEVHTSVPELTTAMLADIGWRLETPSATPPTSSSTATQRATAFVRSVTTDFLGREPTGAELTRWRDHLLAGRGRDTVTRAFAFSDEWIGVIVDGLYRSTLGRSADPGGRAHWVATIRAGRTPAEVASHFYASDEYFRRAGGTPAAWVRDLYAEILGRPADAGGLAFWVERAGAVPRPVIALDFYQSLESRRDRVDALYQRLLGRGPDAGGWAFWADVLRNGRDVDLAVFLAASDEYADRATRRFG